MTQGPPHPRSRRRSLTDPSDLSTLSAAVNNTYDRLDELTTLARDHYRTIAPPTADTPQPRTVEGAACPAHIPEMSWFRRAALVAAEGLREARAADTVAGTKPGTTASSSAFFNDTSTEFLADLGRDLRKYGITLAHFAAATEALGRALCTLHNQPYPGTEPTRRAAEDTGLPPGLIELLETVDLGIRIAALGAVDDDDAGVPAASDAEVMAVQRRSPRVTVVRLSATPPQTGWAGQFLEVRCPADPGTWRSLASAIPPNPAGLLEFAVFHPAATPLEVTPGEHWVVANPTGALEIPNPEEPHTPDSPNSTSTPGATGSPQATGQNTTPVLILALEAGLSAARALILEVANRPSPPQVHLYWQVDHHADLHEYSGLLSLSKVFTWLSVTPVLSQSPGSPDPINTDDAWFAEPEHAPFRSYSHPGPEQLIHSQPLRQGTAAQAAIADNTHRDAIILISGDPTDPASVREAVNALTNAGVAADHITAEP